MPVQRRMLTVGVVTVAILAGGGLILRHGQPAMQRGALAPAAPVPVVAAAVEQRDVPIYLTGVGTVVAFNTVSIRAQIEGKIVSINFTEGQNVRSGDLLAQIDPRPYQAQIDQLTAARDRDQAQLAAALANLDRYLPLFQKGFVTRQVLDAQKAHVAQLQNAVKADEAFLNAAKVQLGFTQLTSPIDGVTGIRQVDVGNIISPSSATGVVVVTQVEPISVIFTLPQGALPRIQEQQEKARGPLMVVAYGQDNRVELDRGALGLVHNEIVQATGSIQLKANFPNKAHRLWPGQLVNARLLLTTRMDGLTVPASAIQQGPMGAYVYVVAPDNTLEFRPVTVSETSDGRTLVDLGLRAGEQVVADGQYQLRPGMAVTVLPRSPAEGAAGQSAQRAPTP